MAKKVIIDIEVNGKMQKATLSAKKLKQALDETSVSQKNLDASTRKGYRAMQGSAQATSNSTKAFSKQAGVVGGLVPVYATFAANVFAVTAAFGVLKRAAALEKLETSLERLGALSGRNLGALAKDLRAVADEAISAEQSLRAVSVGTSAGFSSSQILQLTEVAKGASLALGRDMGDAIDRLIRGTAKLEPEILDELGIIVRLDQAASDYATTINKTANELSQFEKVQAFVNATITQGLNKYQKIAAAVDASPYDKLSASFADLTKEIVNFANVALGPVVDFFATSKFALAGALVFFAGTLVKQVIPAIDEVVARNRLIADSALKAAKKSKTVLSSEYQKAAKKIQVLDFMPKIAKQIIPEVKAGTASIEKLKLTIKSLKASQIARDRSTTVNAQTEKYKAETAAIVAERKELEKLMAQEKNRLTYTKDGLTQRSASRIGRRTAAYGEAIDKAGLLEGFKIASKGVAKNTAEVAKAGDIYGKFTTTAKAAGSAVTLFGRAFMNMIPIIGNVLFALSILSPLLVDLFQKSAVQKSIEETTDRFKIFTKTVALVKDELKDTKSEFSAFTIQARASVGVFDEIKQAFIRLGTTIDNELIEKYKEAIFKQKELQAAADRASSPEAKQFFQKAAAAANPNTGGFGDIGAVEAQAIVASAETALGSMGRVLPAVETGILNLKDELKALGPEGTISLQKLLAVFTDLQSQQVNFIGNLKAATQQYADFRSEVTKLESLQVTPFSSAIEQSKEFQKSAQSAINTFISAGKDASLGDSIESLKDEFPQAIEFSKILEEETGHVITNIQHFDVAMQAYNSQLDKANSIVLKKQGILKKEEAILKEFARNEKIAAGFTRLRLEQENSVIDAKINALDAERTMVDLLLQGNAEKERQDRIDADIEALTNSKRSGEERNLINLQAQFREKQRLAQIEQKILDLTLKRARQQFSQQGRDDERTLRSERQGNAFAFLDEKERSLDLEITRTSELLKAQEAEREKREADARALAELEIDVLSKRLAGEARIASMRAAEIRGMRGSLTPGQEAAAAELESLAGSLNDLSVRVGDQTTAAGDAAAAEVGQEVDSLRAKLEGLVEARRNLEDINVLIDGAARSLESNMTGAFTALISGTKSAKQAFADMAKAILADIAAMIAKQLVLNMLIAATGGSTGFFGNLFGRQGGIFENAPTKRYGGMTEKVPGYAGGGIAKGRQAGYPAILHGTEAVVPLPNGKEIPVEMKNGSGQTNNVTVNVSVDSNGNAQQNQSSTGQQGAGLGKAIAAAVQKELQNQKRSGGILNPYGAA